MSELTVILDKKKLVVSMDANTLRIDRPLSLPQRIPLSMIARVIAIGKPMVSCDVWRALSRKKIPAVLLPSRGKGDAVYMGTSLSGSVEKRMDQYMALKDEKSSLAICRWLLSMKLKGQEEVLKRLIQGQENPESICEPMRRYRAGLQKSDNRNSLMGQEGAAASFYFRTLGSLINAKWKFSGRNRRPPKDPVNALLSLSYVIAGSEVSRVIQKSGFDPAAGFLHTVQPGRESLTLDILEPLRPETDWFVLQLLDRTVTLKNFTTSEASGCLLNKSGRKAYYAAWSQWQESGEEGGTLRTAAKNILNELISFF